MSTKNSYTILSEVLRISQEMYFTIKLDTLELLDWNTAFEQLNTNIPTKNMRLQGLEYENIEKVIKKHCLLLKQGQRLSQLEWLPINKLAPDNQHNLSAKVLEYFPLENIALVNLRMKDKHCECKEKSITEISEGLARRDALLKTVSIIAQELLSESDDFDATIDNILTILGGATDVDRVYIWNVHTHPTIADDKLYMTQLYEWSEGAEPQQGNELCVNMPTDDVIPTWIMVLQAGKCINNHVKNMHQAERAQLEPQNIISILVAPILLHDKLWGFIGFDNCHTEYLWNQTEENILLSAGTLVGSAIRDQHTKKALKKSQERFSAVEEASGDIIWAVDAEHAFTFISDKLTDMLQFKPKDFIGKPIYSLVSNYSEFIPSVTPENPFLRGMEFQVFTENGSTKWLQSSCKYFFDDDGNLLYGIGICTDITALQDVNKALEISNKDLANSLKIANQLADTANQANQAKSHFLTNVSHEIRTPMNAIVGGMHLLESSILTDEQSTYIQQMSEASKSLVGIINDILDFANIESGDIHIETQQFSLLQVMDDIYQHTSQLIKQKNLNYVFNIDPEIEAHYIGDTLRITQILQNLFSNAVKFTKSGTVGINASVKQDTKRYTVLHFEVHDTGIGLENQQIEQLFNSFTQADISFTRNYGGIGLGLALCKKLSKLMHGDVWCESTLGKGSTFHFTCRLKKVKKEKDLRTFETIQDINILAIFPKDYSFGVFKNILNSLGYKNIIRVDNMHSFTEDFCNKEELDVLFMSQEFSTHPLLFNMLEHSTKAIGDTPIILFTETFDLTIPFENVSQISFEASSVHGTLLDIFRTRCKIQQELNLEHIKELLLSHHSGKNILLVEDNAVNQMIIQSILSQVGLNVIIANNGIEACDLIDKHKYHLIIMDIQMPKMDGLTATSKIRKQKQFNHIPIVALTAHTLEEDRQKSFEVGMNDHITKPIDTTLFFKTLLHWLSRTSMHTNVKKYKLRSKLI